MVRVRVVVPMGDEGIGLERIDRSPELLDRLVGVSDGCVLQPQDFHFASEPFRAFMGFPAAGRMLWVAENANPDRVPFLRVEEKGPAAPNLGIVRVGHHGHEPHRDLFSSTRKKINLQVF
jgi:hypothetical protein